MTMQSEDLVLFCTCKQQDILKYSSENWFLGVLNMLFYHFFLFTLNIALLELFYSIFFEPGADKKKKICLKKNCIWDIKNALSSNGEGSPTHNTAVNFQWTPATQQTLS